MEETFDLPQDVVIIKPTSPFTFSCHRGVKCFTECCRMLELALTPYDVLRLRRATGKTSSALLEEVIITEQEVGEPFPRFYLTMIDDGRGSCIYVSSEGCQVYDHRPGACRVYPLGRAAVVLAGKGCEEHFVLIREPHCLGFGEPIHQDARRYMEEQGLLPYNTFNDAFAEILQHDSIKKGFVPSHKQVEIFTLALYDIDNFRNQLLEGQNSNLPQLQATARKGILDDEKLLLFAINWLKKEIFPPF